MDFGFKRSHSSSSNNSTTKSKTEKSNDSQKAQICNDTQMQNEQDTNLATYFPVVKKSNIMRVLPRYTKCLSMTSEEGVHMEALDQIQQDLEELYTTCSVRYRLLMFALEPNLALKQKNLEEMHRNKECIQPATENEVKLKKLRIPKVIPPVYSKKFWLSVDPFCQEINEDNICFLQELIKECSQKVDIKIPELGRHYAQEWSDDNIQSEQSNGAIKPVTKKPSTTNFNNEIKKQKINNATNDTYLGPLSMRLLDTLIEEKVKKHIPTIFDKLAPSDCTISPTKGVRTGACLERRLREVLIEQGILDSDDAPPKAEDEILMEIKKCQEELVKVNEYNRTELDKLMNVVKQDLQKQEIKHKLDIVGKKVKNVYRRILSAKQKHADDMLVSAREICMHPRPNLLKFENEAKEVTEELQKLQDKLNQFPVMYNIN